MTDKELDKFIAEKVMGWIVCYTAETWTDKSEAWWCDEERHRKGETRIGGPSGMGICHEDAFHPAESISYAFQVVDKIHETWLFSRRQAFLKALQDVISESVFELTDVDQKIAWPDLFFYITPKAVCLAAKKAVEMEGR